LNRSGNKQIRYLVFIIIFLFVQLIGRAQEKIKNVSQLKRCSFKTINFEQGLMNNETFSIVTDGSGFTWMSTKTGVQRFNGYIMENINPVVGHDTIFIDYPVIFFPLQNGNIWISYESGILEYSPYTGVFSKQMNFTSHQKGFLPIVPLLQKKDGIRCIYANRGIVSYNENDHSVKTGSHAETAFVDSILESIPFLFNRVNATNGNDIFLSNTKRILHINIATGEVNYLQNSFTNIFGLECSKEKLYVTSEKELNCIEISSGYINKRINYTDINSESIFGSQVYLNGGNQLLVSVNRHLYEFDTACVYQKEFTSLTGDPVVPTGQIHLIYTDRFKRIWLMTNDDIKLIQNVEIPFNHYIYPGLKRNFVKCIYYDEQKKLLLAGCFNGGVLLYDSSGNPLWEKPVATELANDIITIQKLTSTDYLLETYYRGWFILNLPEKKITDFPVPPWIENIIHSNTVSWTNNSQRINDSTIFIATKSNVYNCVFRNTTIRSAVPMLPFLANPKEQFNCFIYTSDKTLWAGTSAGNIFRSGKNGNFQKISTPGNFGIRSCTEDASHNLWIGSDKGLFAYTGSGKLIKKITRETGLLNDCIYALLPLDDQPAVFAGTNFGLSYVSVDGKVKNYTRDLGLQGNEFNNGAACKTNAGKFYFGGVNGITAFYPALLSTVKDTPVLNITRLVINDSVYNTAGNLWNRDTILLKYNQNHIMLDIAANGLLSTDEYIYSYRLKNLEDSWQTTRQPTAIRYTLDPGNYVLEINCSPYLSSDTVFSKKIVIIIYPPWWRTWWFRLLSVVCMAFLIAFIVWQYNRRGYLKKIRALEVQQQIQQERERISRDLHDNLGAYVAAIAANVTRVQETHEAHDADASMALSELQNNSQSIITQLHDTIWALNREAIPLTSISDRFKIFVQKIRPTYPGIDISVKESIETDPYLSPANALHLFRIMQEGLNNALRHSNCQTVIILVESNIHWKVCIIDDGTGIVEKSKNGTGNGLRNMKQRATEAGWNIQWLDERPNGTRLFISPVTATG